jgi:hypothetical protein
MTDSTQPDIPQDLRELYADVQRVIAGTTQTMLEKEVQTLIERIARLETALASVTAENERAMDLVRHQRNELYDEGLIDEKEFTALCADSDGGQRVIRLETYDALKAENARLKAPVSPEECDQFGVYMFDMEGWHDGMRFTPEQIHALLSQRERSK